LKTQYILYFVDLNKREFYIFLPFILGTFVMGVYPNIFLDSIHLSVNVLIEQMYF
jgi:NADH:ubiquinone oxidoreductase subunit 4 (subunit M)